MLDWHGLKNNTFADYIYIYDKRREKEISLD
jgi:hypothetical protein